MAVNVYLNFNGNCKEALDFYADVFKSEALQVKTYGEAPEYSEEAKDLIMYAELTIGGSLVMFSDVYPGTPHSFGNHISLAFVSSDLEVMKETFVRLSEGGTVQMELEETFWSKFYGRLKDRYGVEWQFNHEDEN